MNTLIRTTYNGAQYAGLEVQGEGPGSLGNEERRLEDMRYECIFEGQSFQEQRQDYEGESAQTTPVPVYQPRVAEGMSFRDSAYQTSSTDRPPAPEDTLTPVKAEKILNETKYETAPETVKQRTKKKTRISGTCPECNKVFSQVDNMKRHMGIQHRLNLDGTPIDEGHRKKYQAYNKKPTKSKTTEGLASVSAPDEGKPAKSQAHRAPSPVSIPEVKQLSEAPLSPQSSDYYVTLTDEELESGSEGLPAKKTKASKLIKSPARYPPSDAKHTVTERQPSATTSTGANTGEQIGLLLRKPTRPTKPFHSLRRLRHQLDEPKLIPKVTSLITKSKRLVEMRPSSLVKEVHNKSEN